VTLWLLAILFATGLVAGFVDSIAGGGGLNHHSGAVETSDSRLNSLLGTKQTPGHLRLLQRDVALSSGRLD